MIEAMYVAAQIPGTSTWVATPYDDDPMSIPRVIPPAVKAVLGDDCDKAQAEAVIKSLRIVRELKELVP